LSPPQYLFTVKSKVARQRTMSLSRHSRRFCKRARSPWQRHDNIASQQSHSSVGSSYKYLVVSRPFKTSTLCSNYAGFSRNDSLDDALAALPKDAQLQFDFFGEPVTFTGVSPKDNTMNAMAALDGFILAVATKGKTCTGGGGEQGLEMKAAHASAIAWAELLRHAKVWNSSAADDNPEEEGKESRDDYPQKTATQSSSTSSTSSSKSNQKFAPMLVVAAVAPVLAQAGTGYVQFLDKLLMHGDSLVPGMGPLQMMPLMEAVVARKDDRVFNDREKLHLEALHLMMIYDFETALVTYIKILQTCPGDVLALSLSIDLAYILGDKTMAMRYARTVGRIYKFLPLCF
jgi:hypothetical protein